MCAKGSTAQHSPEDMEKHPEHQHLLHNTSSLDIVSDEHLSVRSLDAPGKHDNLEPIPISSSVPEITSADWTEDGLISSSDNFTRIRRISALAPQEELLTAIKDHETSGEPLIVEGWHNHPQWDTELFSMASFVGDVEQAVDVRNVCTAEDVRMPLGELVQIYQTMSKKAESGETQRFYGKDVPCPERWNEWLRAGTLPAHVLPFGPNDMFSHLPVDDRPETLMCYLGIGDTFTPAHKDLCGSFGQNIMCYTEDGGSAFWFMTTTGHLHEDDPTMYFLDKLGVDLDLESHTTTVAELKDAPFKVYIAEQRLGDLVLVPPRSCHQVVNHGGVTIKMSWSRMGLKSFQMSLYDELPLYRRVCRQEIYRVKLNIFHSVKAYTQLLSDIDQSTASSDSLEAQVAPSQTADATLSNSSQKVEAASILGSLIPLLDDILVHEWVQDHETLRCVPDMHACDFCGADIFQSFFMCPKTECTDGQKLSEFICCPGCYLEGRSCRCQGGHMEPCQTGPFDDLIHARNAAALAMGIHGPPLGPQTLNESPRFHLFDAACKLRQHKLSRAENPHGKPHRRCTTRADSVNDGAHDAPVAHVLNCGHCHAFLCFRHMLDLHGVHAGEALLAHAQDTDQNAWHVLHSAKRRAPQANEQPEDVGSSFNIVKRIAWAAWKFRRCRPIDAIRAREGFYDEFKLVNAVEDMGERKHSGETLDTIPLPNSSAENQASAPAIRPGPEDVSMDSSEEETENGTSTDDSSYTSSSRNPTPFPISNRKHKTKTAVKTEAHLAGRHHKVFDCVLLTSRKRCAAADSAVPTTPKKKAKTFVLPHKSIVNTSSQFGFGTSNVGTLPALATTPTVQAFRQNTLVPVIPALTGPPGSSRTSATQVSSSVRLDRLPAGARIGRPRRRRAHRPILSSRDSSVDRSRPSTSKRVPSAPSTSKRVPSAPSTSKRVPSAPSTSKRVPSAPSTSRNKLTMSSSTTPRDVPTAESIRIRGLELRLEQASAKMLMLKSENNGMKQQGADYRNQITRFKADLAESRRRAEQNKRQTDLAEQKATQLTEDNRALRRTIEDRDQCIKNLQSRLEQTRSRVADQDHTLSGVLKIAGAFGQGIGAAMQNEMPTARYQQSMAGPSYGNSQAQANMQVAPYSGAYGFPRGSMRSRGGGMRQNRRVHGNRNNFIGGSYGFQSRSHSFQRFDDNHYSREHMTQSSALGYPQRRPSSLDRKVIYERESHEHIPFRDDQSESRSYYFDDQESSLHSPSMIRGDYERGDGGWQNVNNRPRDSSVARSIFASRAFTPPRMRSRSPSIRCDSGEDQDPTPNTRRSPEAPQELISLNGRQIESQEQFENLDNTQPGEERQNEPCAGQEQYSGDYNGDSLALSSEQNPWLEHTIIARTL